jgi:ABC-type nitrate/sulfonate/bicarbonate transport system permease component
VVFAGFLLLWYLVTKFQLVSPIFLPSPERTVGAISRGLEMGTLVTRTIATISRMLGGWVLASAAGIALGLAIGMSSTMRAYLMPTLEFLRPLPASAIVPVAISLIGLTEEMILIVIVFGGIWPVLLSTIHGIGAVEPRLYEVARVLNFSRWEVIRKIALPSTMPDIISGMRIGLTFALILTVVGEMLTGRGGLGFWILDASRSFRAADVYAGIAVLGLLGYFNGAILAAIEGWALKWHPSSRRG